MQAFLEPKRQEKYDEKLKRMRESDRSNQIGKKRKQPDFAFKVLRCTNIFGTYHQLLGKSPSLLDIENYLKSNFGFMIIRKMYPMETY